MTAIVATNQGEMDLEAAEPHTVDFVPEVESQGAAAWIAGHKPLVIDVREAAEFEVAHLSEARSIPQAEIATELSSLPRNKDLLLVCAGGLRSLRTANYLLDAGFEKVASLVGGTQGWIEAGNPTEGSGANAIFNDEPERYIHGAC